MEKPEEKENSEKKKKYDDILSTEFVDSIIKDNEVKHACRGCFNIPVCVIARDMMNNFERLGIIQTVFECPYKNDRCARCQE
jgi:hypothetical protein